MLPLVSMPTGHTDGRTPDSYNTLFAVNATIVIKTVRHSGDAVLIQLYKSQLQEARTHASTVLCLVTLTFDLSTLK